MKAVIILALVSAAEGSWEAFSKLSLGKGTEESDPALLAMETAAKVNDAVGTPECKAKAFVINLYKRRDRCICMSQQLTSAPFPAERFNAVTFSDPRTENKRFKTKQEVVPP